MADSATGAWKFRITATISCSGRPSNWMLMTHDYDQLLQPLLVEKPPSKGKNKMGNENNIFIIFISNNVNIQTNIMTWKQGACIYNTIITNNPKKKKKKFPRHGCVVLNF